MPVLALGAGANRVVRGVRIEHLCGDPTLSPEEDARLMGRLVETALAALRTAVAEPTLFDPFAFRQEAAARVPA
jgi:glycine/betaine/sarcosine/D-proline reductase family selenoprotein B